MSNPVDPSRTTAAPDEHSSASGDRDATAPASPPTGAPTAPRFGPPTAAGEVGTLGPYRVLKQLGKGGMGAVYLALDPRLNRKLALKVMLPEFAADHDAKERFLREARAAAGISHDNVVIVHEADERDGVPYIAMQLLQGYPLDEYLRTKGAPPLPHVIRIAREAALGLAAAHALGLVHRDIKPANLWLEAPNGRVKVLDFGLAKPVGSESELTKSGAVVGTPSYMSPEQARGLKVDHRTDLFSLGAVLYRLCTGKNPFRGEHVMAVLAAVLTDEPDPVRDLNPNIPEPLAALIHQMLAKKPDERPPTAADVAKRLRAILDLLAAPGGAEPPVPSATSADVSASMPVVVHPVLMQPPIVVPMQVTAQPESAFADLGADDASATERAGESKPVRKPSGGKGMLIVAAVAVMLAVVVGAVVVSQMSKKNEPEANSPDAGTTGGEKGKGDPKGPNVPAGPLPATYTNGIGMEFVKVPKGTAWLGGVDGKPGETKVEIKADFYLGKYEVTQGEWEAITGLTPSAFKRGTEGVKDIKDADLKRFPVEGVSWDDCQVFIERLNKREKDAGWVYRLPKEAEWEYACRGGPVSKLDSAFDYYFAKPANLLLPDQANFESGKGLKRTCRVGSYEPNSLGLYDMHGNVWEWCEDAATGGDGASLRVDRGGGWGNVSGYCRAADRFTSPPSRRDSYLGLRLARVPSVPGGK
jgi:eukaryotic-like serine/threonine-protein kinase